MQNEVLGDRYQLQEPIGRGGMATIYRGNDTRMERIVAVKVLREVYSTDPKFVTRFQREARAASALQHPNIVQVYDYGQSDGSYYIVMELIDGADLRRYLRSRKMQMLAIDRAIIIAHDVALGLGAAHRRGIVHRDVKPQNVLVGRDGSIKLTDFGIASVYKDINDERLTTTGMTLGTVQYYAPEQAQGEIVSPAADVYALGIVMYEMLAGRTPFDGDTAVAVAMQHIQDTPIPPTQYNPGIPQALEDIIMRCLEKVPEMRYRDGSTLARALEVLGGEELGENIPTKLSSGGLKTTAGAPSFNTIPPRPANSSSRVNNGPLVPAKASASAPNNALVPTPYTQNAEQDAAQLEEMANGATVANNFAGIPPIPDQQTYIQSANGGNGPQSGFNNGGAMLDYNNQAPYYPPADAGTTRPFQRDLYPDEAQKKKKESRFATITTALILLSTLILLGFSIFLASRVFPSFFSGGDTNQSAGTKTPQDATVPNLKNMTWKDAFAKAKDAGFSLTSNPSTEVGVVDRQSPEAGATALRGSPIVVSMTDTLTPAATVVALPSVVGMTVKGAVDTLKSKGFITYKLVNAGPNPKGTETVVASTNPPADTSLPTSTSIIINVYDCGLDVCSIGTPIVVPPGMTPTVGPTVAPTVAPTTAPTVGPTVAPTVAPTPKPDPTAIPTTVPTALPDPTAVPSPAVK